MTSIADYPKLHIIEERLDKSRLLVRCQECGDSLEIQRAGKRSSSSPSPYIEFLREHTHNENVDRKSWWDRRCGCGNRSMTGSSVCFECRELAVSMGKGIVRTAFPAETYGRICFRNGRPGRQGE